MKSEVVIHSVDGISLVGTLSQLPEQQALFISLHGSLLQTRDGDVDGKKAWMFPFGVPQRKLFLDIANRLASKNVGSFRYDKRCSGESGGVYAETDLVTLANDASASLLEMRKRFPLVPIGFVAQSEGTLVALKQYSIGPQPDFLVLQGPSLAPLESIFEFQKTRAAAPFLNDQSGDLAKRFPYLSAFYNAYYHGDLLEKLKSTQDDHYELRSGDWRATTSLRKYRQYGWDGVELLRKVKCPVLIVIGDKDGNVPMEPVDRIIAEQAAGGFSNVEVCKLTGLEHSFREVKEGESFVDAMAKSISEKFLVVLEKFFANRVLCVASK